MICPECKAAGTTSRVYVGGSSTTLMNHAAYYDEAGKYHDHDANIVTSSYSCSNGHAWIVESRHVCPSCDYGKEPVDA